MRHVVVRVVLVLYPRRWRERYGKELQDLLEDLDRNSDRSHTGIMMSLLAGAAEERAGALRARRIWIATAAVMVIAIATIAIVTVAPHHAGANGSRTLQADSGPPPTATDGSQVPNRDPSPRIKLRLQADIRRLCAQLPAGHRATAIELNPDTGIIVGKIVQTCGSPA